MTGLSPAARYFLAQRKAQGLADVTDAQADALAALMVPPRLKNSDAPRAHGASDSPAVPLRAQQGELSDRRAS